MLKVQRLMLGRRDVTDRLQQSAMIEPVDPLQSGELDGFQVSPRSAFADHLGFEQPDHRLREGVVVGVPDAAHRRLNAGNAGRPTDQGVLYALHHGVQVPCAAMDEQWSDISGEAAILHFGGEIFLEFSPAYGVTAATTFVIRRTGHPSQSSDIERLPEMGHPYESPPGHEIRISSTATTAPRS